MTIREQAERAGITYQAMWQRLRVAEGKCHSCREPCEDGRVTYRKCRMKRRKRRGTEIPFHCSKCGSREHRIDHCPDLP